MLSNNPKKNSVTRLNKIESKSLFSHPSVYLNRRTLDTGITHPSTRPDSPGRHTQDRRAVRTLPDPTTGMLWKVAPLLLIKDSKSASSSANSRGGRVCDFCRPS